jgi:hypothetical protein
MIELMPKAWRSWTVVIAGASLLGVVACQPGGEAGEAGQSSGKAAADQAGEAGEAATAATTTPASGAGEAGESGAEHGEAGMEEAYAGLVGNERAAVRIQHLKGFFLVAERLSTQPDLTQAGVLMGQGLLEVYDTAPGQFAELNPTLAREAATGGIEGAPAAEVRRTLNAAIAAMDAEQIKLQVSGSLIARRLVDVSTALYGHVITPDGPDPVEYQHSLGAALAARDALLKDATRLRAENPKAFSDAERELNALIALWPRDSAPETPTPMRTILAQASRAQLALSGLR